MTGAVQISYYCEICEHSSSNIDNHTKHKKGQSHLDSTKKFAQKIQKLKKSEKKIYMG